ncbi:MAG: L-aspartate oxidase, partial [uncultured Thermomicrobiales bacterium]
GHPGRGRGPVPPGRRGGAGARRAGPHPRADRLRRAVQCRERRRRPRPPGAGARGRALAPPHRFLRRPYWQGGRAGADRTGTRRARHHRLRTPYRHRPGEVARRRHGGLRGLCSRHGGGGYRHVPGAARRDARHRGLRPRLRAYHQPPYRDRRRRGPGVPGGGARGRHGVHPVPSDHAVPPGGQVVPDQRGRPRRGRHPAQQGRRVVHGALRRARQPGPARHRGPGHRRGDEADRRPVRVPRCDPAARRRAEVPLPQHLRPLPLVRHRHDQRADPRGSGGALLLRRRRDGSGRAHVAAPPVRVRGGGVDRRPRRQPPRVELAARGPGVEPPRRRVSAPADRAQPFRLRRRAAVPPLPGSRQGGRNRGAAGADPDGDDPLRRHRPHRRAPGTGPDGAFGHRAGGGRAVRHLPPHRGPARAAQPVPGRAAHRPLRPTARGEPRPALQHRPPGAARVRAPRHRPGQREAAGRAARHRGGGAM